MHPVLSHYQAKEILAARKNGAAIVSTSLDLNLTQITLPLIANGVQIYGQVVTYEQLQKIADTEAACFLIASQDRGLSTQHLTKIQIFSEFPQRFYSLFPTSLAPTMMVSGFPMHRIKDIDPIQDTLNKIKAISPLKGKVLDTTMGLGYTAIQAAKTASI